MSTGMSTDLFGTESTDPLDQGIGPQGAVQIYESDKGGEGAKDFYEPEALDMVKGVYVTNAAEKQRLEEKQLELYEPDE